MPSLLKPGFVCPECGEHVVMIYHEWSGHDQTATFEYHHLSDVQRDKKGEKIKPCIVIMSYDEGMRRFQEESL